GGAPGAASLFVRAVLGLGGEWWAEYVEFNPRFVELLEEALGLLDGSESALRAQVLSRLAIAIYYFPDAMERCLALSEEALDIARRLGDPVTLACALHGRHWALWTPEHLGRRLVVANELVRLAESSGAREMAIQAHVWRLGDLLELGNLDAVDGEIETVARLANELRQPLYQWWPPMFRAMRALLEGRFTDAELLAEEGVAIGQRVQGRVALRIFGSHLVF